MKSRCPTLCLVLMLLAAPAAVAGTPSAPSNPGSTLAMDPVEINGEAISSYPIGLKLVVNKETKRIRAIFITSVQPDSDAAHQGLQPGDEIIKIDGQPVDGMDPTIDRDSPLGRIFLKRPPGTQLWLDVIVHHTKQVLLTAGIR